MSELANKSELPRVGGADLHGPTECQAQGQVLVSLKKKKKNSVFFWPPRPAYGILVSQLGIEPMSPTVGYGILTAGPPGNSLGPRTLIRSSKHLFLNGICSISSCFNI